MSLDEQSPTPAASGSAEESTATEAPPVSTSASSSNLVAATATETTTAPGSDSDPISADEPLDLDRRFLCADGACIGTIEISGRCKLCDPLIAPELIDDFEAAWGVTVASDIVREAPLPAAVPAEIEPVPVAVDDSAPPDLDNRVLCADGACIGVVGADGCCKVCGKASTELTC